MIIVETTVSGVVQFVIKKVAVIFVRWRRRRLHLVRRGPGDDGCRDTEKQADKEQSYLFHRLRCGQRSMDEQLKVRVSHQKYSGKKEFREICRGAISSIYAGRLASWTERFSLFASTLPEVVFFLPTGNIDAWRYAHRVASSQTRHVVQARSVQSASARIRPSSTVKFRIAE